MRLTFFFFQAEDGIRDYKVTGVQTCALPIYDQLGQRKPGLSVSHIRSPVTYHCTTPSPQNNAAAPPIARKGPNGIASLRPRTPRAIRATAHAPPSTTPTISANSAIFQPRKAPSIAPSAMRPGPVP